MSEFGSNGPFKWGTAAQRALLTTGDLAVGDVFLEIDTGDAYRCSDATGPVMVPHVQGSKPRWEDTLTNLKAKGTDDGLAVGHTAIVTNRGNIVATCLTAAATTSTWGVTGIETREFMYSLAAATADLGVAWVGVVGSATLTTREVGLMMSGTWTAYRVVIRCNATSPGVTTLKIGKNHTAAQAADGSANISVQDTAYTFSWAAGFSGVDGDKLHVTVSPTGNHSTMHGFVEFVTIRTLT